MKNKFNFKSIILTLTLLTLGVGQVWGDTPQVRGFMNGWSCTAMTQVGSSSTYYYKATSNGEFKVQNGCNWDNDKNLSHIDNSLGNITLSQNGDGNNISCSQGGTWYIVYNGSKVYATTVDPSTPPTYTVTYNGNGKTSGSVPTDASSPYSSGATVTVKGNTGNLAKTGCTFGGWMTNQYGGGTTYAPGETFTISGNTTLYAKWITKTIYVYDNLSWNSMKLYTWDSNNSNQTYNGGWSGESLSQIGSTKWYQVDIVSGPNKLILNNGSAQTEDITIASYNPSITEGHSYEIYDDSGTKKLREKTLTVSFNMKSHGSAVSSQNIYYNGLVTEPSPAPSATGYTFGGWYKETGCTNAWNFGSDRITAARTLYAKWTAKNYTITYYLNGGTQQVSPAPATSYTIESSAITLPTPSKDGCNFDGWFDNSSFTGSAITTIAAGSTGNKEYWAKWSTASTYYDVTFGVHASGHGTLAAVKTATSAAITSGDDLLSGTAITFTASPSSYYEVEGWYTNAACTEGKHDAGETTYSVASLGSDIKVYVKFKPITYTITYNLNSGTNNPSNPANYTYESSAITLQDPTRTGYTFGGWYTEVGLTNRVYSIAAGSNGNKAFWAKWTENMTTVTINVSPASSGTLTVGGAAFTPGNTTTAGVSTSRTVVATAANSDYTFNNWTKTGNAAGSASTNTYTLKGNGSGSTGTLTANFNLVECKLLYGSSTPLNSPTDGGAMSYDATEHAYYKDVTTNSSPYYFQFGIGSKKYANGAWDTYPNVQEATANGAKIDCADDVSGWDNKASIKFTGTSGSSIRIWFDQQNKKAWITETGYSVTINNGDHGTVSPNGSQTVGASGITIKATPEEGYKLSSWTVTGGAHVASSTSATTTLTATADGTVTAIYETESPIRLYYSNPAGWSNVYAYLWDVDNTSDKNANWPGTDITTNIELVDCQQFYYYEYYPSAHAGWDRIIFNGGDGSKQTHDLPFSAATNAGQYQNAGKDEDGSWQDPTNPWYFAYDGDSWSTTAHPLTCTSATSGYVELDLAANTDYAFKFIENGSTWYGCTTPTKITYENKATAQTMNNTAGGSADQTIKTAGAGTYRFTWDITNKRVTVTYPTSYKVELEVGTVKGNKNTLKIYHTSTTAGNEVTSGNYVAAGTKVYFWAATSASEATICKAGYTWWGFYNNASGTGSDLPEKYTTAEVSMFNVNPITSDMHVYAVFGEKDYWITPYINGQGSISPNGANAHIATPTEFTANPGTGYKFDSWEERDGSAMTIATPSVATTNVTTSAAATLQANFSPRWSVIGTGAFGGWTAYDAHKFDGYNVVSSKNVGYNTITLAANTTYEIKTYDRETSTFYGGSANQDIDYAHSGSGNEYTIATTADPKSVFIHSAAAGSYTLNWNLTDKKIAVVYPTSWYITTGQKTTGQDDNAGGSFTAVDNASNNVYGGKFVANNATVTFTATPNTGYNFDGWYTDEDCTEGKNTSNPMTISSITANKTIYAKFVPETYTVTLTRSGTGYGSGGSGSVTATYNATLPAATLPTAANGYAFMGYYSATGGKGTQFMNASGTWATSVPDTITDGKWVLDEGATLYAYYKKAEITEITLNQSIFEPVASGTSYVKAEPTIEPTPEAPTKICWELLYDNDNPVTSHYAEDDSEVGHENRVKFNLAGLAAGSYRIRATLYTGTECSGGTLLSTYDKTVTIANEFTVTVKYMCGTEEIQASTTTPGKATQWTSISAPDIFGYTFDRWDLGDGGITKHESDAITKQSDFRFKASYNGILTAKYTKNKYIYLDLSNTFSSSGQWNNPYCYLYNSDGYWDDSKGAGATGPNCVKKGAMTQIGSTNIWYYDYSDASTFVDKLAFTWGDKGSYDNFCEDAIYRSDFSEGTPLFIPAVGQTGVKKNSNCATYYNAGYWTNYTGSKTGYTLLIYNSSGTGDPIKTRLFTSTSNDMRMTMKATVDLEAATTYKVEILRDNGHYYKNSDERNYGNSQVNKKYLESGTKGNIVTTAAGDYVFTLSYTDNSSDKDFQIRMIVDYPAAVNDFQVMYNDNATWSLGTAHTEGWRHPSRMIKARAGGVDTISFFVGKTNSPKLYARKVTNASSLTWASLNIADAASMSLSVDSSAVYNFKVTQSTAGVIASIENIGAYTGEYYIRCDAVNSKWDNYTTDDDHRMTYSSFSESDANAFGEKYSHYKAKWCKYGKNVKFVIANDYSPCISDTLVQDVPDTYENINEDGFLKDDGTAEETKNRYSANIRFMWNRKTNKISRAYVASSTNASRLFLVLRGNTAIKGLDDSPIEDEGSKIPSVILQDDQNWIYEEVLYIKPNTRFKLYACYAQVTASPNGAQYFRGTYNGNAFSGEDGKDSENSVVLIGGSGETYQKARVLYDFKTNRLICAWLPSSSAIDEKIGINADVMVIREHHEPAQYISFKYEDSKLTGVKTVYGVMKFNRWVLNNRKQTGTHGPLDVGNQKSIYERSLYFVSFPFDVRVGDIFGFGRYWDEWYLEYYDGLNRAKNGFWLDSPPNWKYVTPEMATDYVLKANVGYILGLDLDFMAYDNTTFWAHDIETIELFFPSTVAQETLQQVNCTIPALSAIEGDPYRCTINRGDGTEGDRRVKDSYWHCMGVPSFNIYNTSLKDASGTAITWQPSGNTLPFIYMWNKADNTLTAQSTSTFTFLPMHAYLVQNGGEIRWENVSAKGPSSIVARRVNEQPVKEYEWRLALMSDTNLIDQTYVKMSNLEQVTDTFDFNQDLIKEFNKTRSNIYSYIGYEQVAANSMPLQTEQTTVIPVGVKIKTAGDYTFAMPDGTNGVGVTLIDTETGVRTSLGLMDYTVTLTAGSFNQRFFLEISPVSNVATDIELINDENGDASLNGVRKVLIDNKLFLIKDGEVYDARGAKVK